MTINTYTPETEIAKSERIALAAFKKTAQLAELKLSYRRKQQDYPSYRIDSTEVAIHYLRQLWDKDTLELREEFMLICLSNSLDVNGWIKLYSGGFQDCPVDVRLILGIALQTASCAILVAHNHPSGQVMPSYADKKLTAQIAQASRVMGIRLLDHVILTSKESFSFRDREPGALM
ncbi:MAG: JAB domain-containing protein [Planctomycetia bacterium]|nr:JAB domain-containing protein [Planctomycetia bacterium]